MIWHKLITWYHRHFQERHAITRAGTQTHTKAFRSVINLMCKSNFWLCFYCITACVWLKYVPMLMLLLNRWLSLIIKLKLSVFWFWKLLILYRKIFFSVQFTSIQRVYLHVQRTRGKPNWKKPATHNSVHWGINPPSKTLPLFLARPPLNLQTV